MIDPTETLAALAQMEQELGCIALDIENALARAEKGSFLELRLLDLKKSIKASQKIVSNIFQTYDGGIA